MKRPGFVHAGFNQANAEHAARRRLASINRSAEMQAAAKIESDRVRKERLELLKPFAVGDPVTNGKKMAKVKRIDLVNAALIVTIVRTCKEEQWAPDFVKKA